MKTKSNPYGNGDTPVNPITLALSAGATFVGRGFSGDQKHLVELIKQAIQHQGFSFLDIFSPCVTYNHDNTFQWFRPRVKKLEDNPEYDASNWVAAMEKATLWGDEIPIGKFYQTDAVPTLEQTEPVLDAGPLIQRELHIAPDVARKFVEELM
jgi:2-oxoglutarate ferredoxin oxidoreductase subunit beta